MPSDSFAQIMRHASVMLVPSYSETFGLVALEASASGVPTLAAAAGGLTEAICNGHTGQLVTTHEPQDWADAQDLYRILEQEAIPAYYERDAHGLPDRWLALMRRSIATTIWRLYTTLMLLYRHLPSTIFNNFGTRNSPAISFTFSAAKASSIPIAVIHSGF